jgi:hypothetical protein
MKRIAMRHWSIRGRIILFCTFLFASTIGSGECLAHRDIRVTVEDDGTLVGIPPDYGPAALHVAFASSTGGPRIATVVLDLGRNHTRLPACVTGLLRTSAMNDIRASASWYHDESIVPYYLNLEFFDPGYNASAWANAGHSLLFDLHTGKLLQMQALIVQGKSLQHGAVDLAARCPPAELEGILSDSFEKFQRRATGTVTEIRSSMLAATTPLRHSLRQSQHSPCRR